jgi:hypothetical protein
MNRAAAPFVRVQQIFVRDDYGFASQSANVSQLRVFSPAIGNPAHILPRYHADAGRP